MTLLETITTGFQTLETLAVEECRKMTASQLADVVHVSTDAIVATRGVSQAAAMVVKTVAEAIQESRE